MRHWTIWTFAMVFIVSVLVRLPGLERLLDGSEVDCVRAARRGFLTNYLDIGTAMGNNYRRVFEIEGNADTKGSRYGAGVSEQTVA